MGLIRSFFNNTRKPTGLRGGLMLSKMNAEHAAVPDWGMAQLPEISPRSIAELGCGGGRNAAELLRRYPEASLTAIDYSPESVERTARVNAADVAAGRCGTIQAAVSDLPLPDDSFDLATAFETVYFWPGPTLSLREAGFVRVRSSRDERRHWLCLLAEKPVEKPMEKRSEKPV